MSRRAVAKANAAARRAKACPMRAAPGRPKQARTAVRSTQVAR